MVVTITATITLGSSCDFARHAQKMPGDFFWEAIAKQFKGQESEIRSQIGN